MVHEYVKEKFNADALSRELEASASETWIAVQAGILGYCKIIKEPPPEFVRERSLVHLERIYVLGDFQGKGIGKALLAKAEERALVLGFSGLWLGVWEKNVQAIQFYLHRGFSRAGSHRWEYSYKGFDYQDIDDVMIKVVSPLL